MRGAVFLSASVPVPSRGNYLDTCSVVAIREAVLAVVAVVLPRARLVMGGHPAITPLVWRASSALGLSSRVHLFQSEFFESFLPPEASEFANLHWTARLESREESLRRMRLEMLGEGVSSVGEIAIGFFVGGMEGVQEEYGLLKRLQPTACIAPVGATGAAARIIWDRESRRRKVEWREIELPGEGTFQSLRTETHFRRLFAAVLRDCSKSTKHEGRGSL